MKNSFANNMGEAGPQAIEMPANISESGMMMGAMVMAKPSLAGGLPGAMAPPEGMTATAMGAMLAGDAPSGQMMGDVMQDMGTAKMGEAMADTTQGLPSTKKALQQGTSMWSASAVAASDSICST